MRTQEHKQGIEKKWKRTFLPYEEIIEETDNIMLTYAMDDKYVTFRQYTMGFEKVISYRMTKVLFDQFITRYIGKRLTQVRNES